MSRQWIFLLLLLLLLFLACSRQPLDHQVVVSEDERQPPTQPVNDEQSPTKWPKDWSAHVGKVVTVEGMSINQKVGAALWGEGETVFIDGLNSWPDGFYLGGEKGKRLCVTGTVIERHDLPVFIPRKGEPAKAGIPVPEGTDLHKASRRFLLQDAKWTVIE